MIVKHLNQCYKSDEDEDAISDEAWNPPSNWNGTGAVLYRHFDSSCDLVLMEGSQQMNIIPLITGKVIVKWNFDYSILNYQIVTITTLCITILSFDAIRIFFYKLQ